MQIDNPELSTATYEIDLSDAWDTESETELFFEEIKKLGLYKKDLLYSGFNGDNAGISSHSDTAKNIVYCSPESYFFDKNRDLEHPLKYAFGYERPAVAIYDPSKLKATGIFAQHKIEDPTALIAIILIK